MKKIAVNVLSVILAVALAMVPITSTTAMAANEAEVVAQVTVNGTVYEFDSLSSAVAAAATGSNLTVYLVKNYILPADLEIPSNVTVTIPTSADYNDTITGVNNVTGNGSSGSPNVTLTIPAGVTLDVKGSLLVAGNQQSTQPRTGFLTGNYGAINLQGSIVVNGTLYARGEITGPGSVTVTSVGKVYERFEIADWRGGTESDKAARKDVFPFSLYSFAGINADLNVMPGAFLYGQLFIHAGGRNVSMDIPLIGYTTQTGEGYTLESYLIGINDKDVDGDGNGDGFVTLSRDAETGVTTITTRNVNVVTGNMQIRITIFGITLYEFNSAEADCPFGYKMNVVLESGTTMTVGTELEVLPGCSITVKSGASIAVTDSVLEGKNIHGSMNFYGTDAYKKDFYFGTAADWDYNVAAQLSVEDGGQVTAGSTNDISSTEPTFNNVDGYEAVPGDPTVPVLEWNQGTSEVVTVWFYKGTPKPTTAE